jgi:hypothetical protein
MMLSDFDNPFCAISFKSDWYKLLELILATILLSLFTASLVLLHANSTSSRSTKKNPFIILIYMDTIFDIKQKGCISNCYSLFVCFINFILLYLKPLRLLLQYIYF